MMVVKFGLFGFLKKMTTLNRLTSCHAVTGRFGCMQRTGWKDVNARFYSSLKQYRNEGERID